MKLFPRDIAERLEFNKVLHMLAELCISPMAANLAEHLKPVTDRTFIERSLDQISELKELQAAGQIFPARDYLDISTELRDLGIADFVLSEEEMHRLACFLKAIASIFSFIEKNEEKGPRLKELLQGEKYSSAPAKQISAIIDETGHMRSNASPELERIRREMQAAQNELDKVFRRTMQIFRQKGYLAEAGDSVRNGRRVLAVLAEHKRVVKGIIHDDSDSGKTCFIEPDETVFLSNEIFELERSEQREKYRILKDLSTLLRVDRPLLQKYFNILTQADLLRAKTRLSEALDASAPGILDEPSVDWVNARHPVLYAINRKAHKDTIPMSARLNDDSQVILISGPNAGGKSVSMKCFGILQLMLQCGLHVPTDPSSSCGIFQQLMADLGDAQSLEDELSTYSSRLRNMRLFLQHANRKTLFLIDEFGTGTDPLLGGAIAESILRELLKLQARGVVNTHYGNLKVFAEKNEHIVNAAMIFDEEHLSPTYRLQIGRPGSSYTFVIAQKNRLPRHIIQYAEKLVGNKQVRFEDLLYKVETERKDLEKQATDIEYEDKKIKDLMRKLELQQKDLEYQRKKLKYEYYLQKHEQAAALEKQIQSALKEIKQAKNAEEAAREAVRAAQEKKEEMLTKAKDVKSGIIKQVSTEKLKAGSKVKLIGSNEIGEIEQIKKDKAVVIFDIMKTTVPLEDLEEVDERKAKAILPKRSQHQYTREQSHPELDLRGMMKEEAYPALERFIDQALMAGFPEVRILHGKGTGALRMMVKDYLRSIKAIREIYHPAPEFGGDGITCVRI